jgi:uncharacterized membrane protein YidH (DUF202 family)
MSTIDPKVYFSSERTFLKWLHMSVSIGSVGAALLGLVGTGGNPLNSMRVVGLLMVLISILFCAHTLFSYHKRSRLLRSKAGTGYDSGAAPHVLAATIVFGLVAMYVMFLVNKVATRV